MEESLFRQFTGDKNKGILIVGHKVMLQIKVLTGKGLQEKMLLTEALESGVYLDPKQLAFLVDNGDTVIPAQASQEISSLAAFQTYDLDAFDFDCDDEPSAKAVLVENLFSYDLDVLLDVLFHDTNIENDISYQSVQEPQCS
uniref:Retrovirus-related Pol polyprotein from transposon TNT 1-94 n=1 Tax=Tanacetum cinerariifolium TaxID=118510 RepID=A0A6L2NJA5_TANCI|nr:hypothetical protein [Tanacetum cinerariifolium]